MAHSAPLDHWSMLIPEQHNEQRALLHIRHQTPYSSLSEYSPAKRVTNTILHTEEMTVERHVWLKSVVSLSIGMHKLRHSQSIISRFKLGYLHVCLSFA